MEQGHPPPPVVLARRQHRLVTSVIERWQDSGVIDHETGARLAASVTSAPLDFQRSARYAFIIAIICLVIATFALMADRMLMKLLLRLFAAPAAVKCTFFGLVSAALFVYGLGLRNRQPHRVYSNESVFLLGGLALAAALYFLGETLDLGADRYSRLLLLACALYGLLGLWFPSALVWVFGLLCLSGWMGAETGYLSGYGMYYLGMNYPLRFMLFGGSLTLLGLAGLHAPPGQDASTLKARLLSMSRQTTTIGLLHLFIALWLLSIFGNHADIEQWEKVRQYELFHWSVLFAAASIAAIWYGLKWDDGLVRGFGLTFLFINLYTRFFEYFWNALHKAAFFALLAVSFWYLGRRAEAIRHFGAHRLQSGSGVPPAAGQE